jgi:hypothetical protein
VVLDFEIKDVVYAPLQIHIHKNVTNSKTCSCYFYLFLNVFIMIFSYRFVESIIS